MQAIALTADRLPAADGRGIAVLRDAKDEPNLDLPKNPKPFWLEDEGRPSPGPGSA